MKNLKAKLRKNGGFTLIEMLIVVAIIAILIAISIPLVGTTLERARMATDAANERAAKAEMILVYINSTTGATGGTTYTKDAVYAYDAASGKLMASTATPSTKYGQCTTHDHKGKYLYVTYDETDGEVKMAWGTTAPAKDAMTGDLCSSTVGSTT